MEHTPCLPSASHTCCATSGVGCNGCICCCREATIACVLPDAAAALKLVTARGVAASSSCHQLAPGLSAVAGIPLARALLMAASMPVADRSGPAASQYAAQTCHSVGMAGSMGQTSTPAKGPAFNLVCQCHTENMWTCRSLCISTGSTPAAKQYINATLAGEQWR